MNKGTNVEVNKGAKAQEKEVNQMKELKNMTKAELLKVIEDMQQKQQDNWISVGAVFQNTRNGKTTQSVVFDQLPQLGIYYNVFPNKKWTAESKLPKARICIHKDQLDKQLKKLASKSPTKEAAATEGSKDTQKGDL